MGGLGGGQGEREGAPFLFLFLRRDPGEQEQSCGMCCRLQLCISNRIWSDRPNVLLRFAPQYVHPWITVLNEMPQCYWKIHWRSRQSSGLFFFCMGFLHHAVIFGVTLINHSLQQCSPWRLAVADSPSVMHTCTQTPQFSSKRSDGQMPCWFPLEHVSISSRCDRLFFLCLLLLFLLIHVGVFSPCFLGTFLFPFICQPSV